MGLALFLLICVVIMFLLLPPILYPKKDKRRLPVYHHPVTDKSTTVINGVVLRDCPCVGLDGDHRPDCQEFNRLHDVPTNKVVIPPEDNAF